MSKGNATGGRSDGGSRAGRGGRREGSRGGRRSGGGGAGAYGAAAPVRRVPRTQRVNEVLRQVLAEQLPRIADLDPTVGLLTVTGVTVEPDLRHATVWLDSLPEPAKASLATHRAELQSAIATQMHMKRTPLLAFAVDPAVTTGGRIEQILRQLGPTDGSEAAGAGEEHDE